MTGATDRRSLLEQRGARFADDRPADFGDPAGELAAAAEGAPILADLGHRALVTVGGTEVLSFFQGQLTNDVYPAEHGTPVLAAHLTPKGRVLATLLLFPFADGFAADFPGDMLESLLKRLRMFVLRSDVRMEDAGARWTRIGVTGDGAAAAAGAAAGAEIPGPDAVTRGSEGTVVPLPGPSPAFLVLVPSEQAGPAWDRVAAQARPVGQPAWELARIRAGVPDLGAELSDHFLPQEANLEPLGGISYTKGCYTGQEVVARTKHLGRLKRRLFRVAADTELAAGQAIRAAGQDQSLGRIVSAAPRPDGGWEALAILRIEAVAGGLRLAPAGTRAAELRILELPYAVEEATR